MAARVKVADPAPMIDGVAQPAVNPRARKPAVKPRVLHPVPVAEAVQSELERTIGAMAIEHVQCRDFGHSWRPFSARWQPSFNCYEVILRCARCTTTRTRQIGARGQQLGSSYDYVDGYQMPSGTGHMTGSDRDIFRLRSVRAILIQDTVEE